MYAKVYPGLTPPFPYDSARTCRRRHRRHSMQKGNMVHRRRRRRRSRRRDTTKATSFLSSPRGTFSYVKASCALWKGAVKTLASEAWYWIKRLVIKDAAIWKDRGIISVCSQFVFSSVKEERKFRKTRKNDQKKAKKQELPWTQSIFTELKIAF